jgi:sporulation protein YqfC
MARRGQRRWVRQVGGLLELPGDALLNLSRLIVVGDQQVVVENHRGLLGYYPHQVVLRVPEGRVTITGENLVIGHIDTEELSLSGKVTGVAFAPPEPTNPA